jgi:AcrR family transcriptional regulator
MGIEDRKLRERAARHALITATARSLAEAEGWEAVTTRRLSTEIEYSQPVIYRHFASMEDVIEAVAIEGFAELAQALQTARLDGPPARSLRRVAHAFSRFATDNPAVYDAMFTRATRLQFAAPETPPSLAAAFIELRQAVRDSAAVEREVDTLTEVLWAALHGLATLARNGRLRPGLDGDRIELLVGRFEGAGEASD